MSELVTTCEHFSFSSSPATVMLDCLRRWDGRFGMRDSRAFTVNTIGILPIDQVTPIASVDAVHSSLGSLGLNPSRPGDNLRTISQNSDIDPVRLTLAGHIALLSVPRKAVEIEGMCNSHFQMTGSKGK